MHLIQHKDILGKKDLSIFNKVALEIVCEAGTMLWRKPVANSLFLFCVCILNTTTSSKYEPNNLLS